MKKAKRRALSIVLAVIMVITTLPAVSLSAFAAEGVPINETTFPDENFRAYVGKNFDKDSNSYLSDKEIDSVTKIDVWHKNIADLTGIEYFTKLTYLNCSYNRLTSLDISGNTDLTSLECYSNQLISLDVSNNTVLTELVCSGNRLTSLDISGNTTLTNLICGGNPFTSLDVNNTALTSLDCSASSGQLTSLNASNNTALTKLDCSGNRITSLDISGNTALTSLNCSYNDLTALDISCNTALTSLDCSDYSGQLASLNVSNNTALAELDCSGNRITSLDVSYNTALTSLYCGDNEIETLILNNPELTHLSCCDNFLTELNVDNCTRLEWLNCCGNYLSELNVDSCTQLNYLYCDVNELASLDVRKCVLLYRLSCAANKLSSLNVSECIALEELQCNNNQIKELVFANNSALGKLNCSNSNLTELDLSNNIELSSLDCNDNNLTEIDLSNNPKLWHVYCANNSLTELDLSAQPNLYELNCSNNNLTKFDLNTGRDWWNKFKVSNQIATADATITPRGYIVDFEKLLGKENLTKVEIQSEDWQYDSETGEALYTGEDIPENLTYIYNGDKFPSDGMAVTLTLISKDLNGISIADSFPDSFPDEIFRNYVRESFDSDFNGYLSDEEISAVTKINVSNKEISDLTGINCFTALTELYCCNNRLTALDLNKNLDFAYVINQHSTAKVKNIGGRPAVNLSEIIGKENLRKVSLEPGQNWQYNSATGIATYLGMGAPETLTYIYRGTNLQGGINVALALTAESNEKIVVMKKEENNACVNGELLPTTDYGNDIFAKAISKPGGYVLPLRYIGEQFGMTVEYLGGGQTKVSNAKGEYIVVKRDDTAISKYSAQDELIETFTANTAVFTDSSITYVPLRAVSEALGLGVRYQSTAHGSYVVISTDANIDSNLERVTEEIEKAHALYTDYENAQIALKDDLLNYYWVSNSSQLTSGKCNIWEFKEDNKAIRYVGELSSPKSSWQICDNNVAYTLNSNKLTITYADGTASVKLKYVKKSDYSDNENDGYFFYETDFSGNESSITEAMFLEKTDIPVNVTNGSNLVATESDFRNLTKLFEYIEWFEYEYDNPNAYKIALNALLEPWGMPLNGVIVFNSAEKRDPLNLFYYSYGRVSADEVDYIIKNIYNIEPKRNEAVVDRENDFNIYYYDNYYYWEYPEWGDGPGPFVKIKDKKINIDGSYTVTFNICGYDGGFLGSYKTECVLRMIDGKRQWSFKSIKKI